MNKCIFLDRDGVLNIDRGDYIFLPEDFVIVEGVPEAIRKIKEAGYLAIVVTNQAGITKGLYSREQMNTLHAILMERAGFLIDKIYYSPYHSSFSESLAKKPDTLMIEKAIARFNIDPAASWIIGDRDTDMACGERMGLGTVLIEKIEPCISNPTLRADNLLDAVNRILDYTKKSVKAKEIL